MRLSQQSTQPAPTGFDSGHDGTAFGGGPAVSLVPQGATAGEPPVLLSVPGAVRAFQAAWKAAPESYRPT